MDALASFDVEFVFLKSRPVVHAVQVDTATIVEPPARVAVLSAVSCRFVVILIGVIGIKVVLR